MNIYDQFQALLEKAKLQADAEIFQGSTQRPFEIQTITLALDTAKTIANPFPIKFPFRSVFVSSSTDVATSIKLRPYTVDSVQSDLPLKSNDSWSSDKEISNAYLTWDAQAGKTITLQFLLSSEFRSGSQVSVTGGGVAIIDGSIVTEPTVTTLAAATQTSILAQDTTRKQASIYNDTGATLFLGIATVTDNAGAKPGFPVQPGAVFQWKNTAQLYAYSTLGGKINILQEF